MPDTKDFIKKHVSEWMFDDGNNKLLWKDKAATVNEVLDFLAEARAEERSELLLELLQVFNDYEVPLTMTAEQVRDILEEYLTK